MKSTIVVLLAVMTTVLCAGTVPGFRVDPYLLRVDSHSAVVACHLEEPQPLTVIVDDGAVSREFPSPQKKTSHFVAIDQLEPGVVYTYRVKAATAQTPAGDQSFQIRTAGLPGEYFTFTVFGDPRPGDNMTHHYHEAVVDRVLMQEPVFNLVLGDMVDDGSQASHWEQFFAVESQLLRRSAVYPVIGDNDRAEGDGKYQDYFPFLDKGYYSFEWGGIHFFGLYAWDTRGRQPASQFNSQSPQAQWFAQQMERPEVKEAPFRVVFLHDPVVICRGRASETLQAVWMPLFQKHKVDVVFASWHLYERSQHQGVTYVISGGAGAELLWMNRNPAFPSQVEARQYHFCRVDVNTEAMTLRGIATDGTVLDSLTLTPRSNDPGAERQLRRAARRLAKESVLNGGDGRPRIPVYLFSYDCRYCKKLTRFILPGLARQYGIAIELHFYDLGRPGVYDLFLNAGAEFGRQGSDIPAIFMGRTVLGGEQEIEHELHRQLEAFSSGPDHYLRQSIQPFNQSHDTLSMGEQAFNGLTAGVVWGAGLLDGLNPCAFSTIVFLVSYLSLVGASRKKMLYTGGIFTLAVFLTYFLIGLLFFGVARIFLQGGIIPLIVNSALLAIVLALAVLSFMDGVKCLRGRSSDMALQLPDRIKGRIHEKIRDFSRRKLALAGASFGLGVMIAGMELTCTGQVYIPIVTMISDPRHRVAATAYLFVYNVAFIIPLLAVFGLVFFGLTSKKLGQMFHNHLAAVKFSFALLFLVMGLLIGSNLGWFS
jgi:cytochrome c biogenesis protein CcdA